MLAVCPDRSVPIHELVVKVLRSVSKKKTLLDTDSSDCDDREGSPKRDRRVVTHSKAVCHALTPLIPYHLLSCHQ